LLPPLLLLLAAPASLVHLSIKVKLTSKALHQQTVMVSLCTRPGSGNLRCLLRFVWWCYLTHLGRSVAVCTSNRLA
jgi:hypothetical protein